jgi:thiaminase
MNIKIFKTRKEFKESANGLFEDSFYYLHLPAKLNESTNPNIPYVAYARYIEKTIHGEDASEVKGFKPSQNQRITDRLQEKLIKLLTKDAEEIVLTNDLSQVHLIAEKHDGNLQVAINRLIDSSASYLEAHEKKHIDPNNNVWLYINNHEVYLSKRQTIKINQAIQDKLDEYWAENQTEDEKEATRAEGLREMNEGR